MTRYPTPKNRVCYACGDIENRDATKYELQNLIVISFMRVYENNRWTGKYICSRCKAKFHARDVTKRKNKEKNLHKSLVNKNKNQTLYII